MTKKLTISAAATVAALALAGGSAGAHAVSSAVDASIAPGDIAFATVQPDPFGSQAFFDLVSTTGMAESLDGHTVFGCGRDNVNPFQAGFTSTNVAPPEPQVFRIADVGYSGIADVRADLSWLNSNDYDLRLMDNFTFEVVAHTSNGNPNEDCVANMPPITP